MYDPPSPYPHLLLVGQEGTLSRSPRPSLSLYSSHLSLNQNLMWFHLYILYPVYFKAYWAYDLAGKLDC